jgi:hypothetical protein
MERCIVTLAALNSLAKLSSLSMAIKIEIS